MDLPHLDDRLALTKKLCIDESSDKKGSGADVVLERLSSKIMEHSLVFKDYKKPKEESCEWWIHLLMLANLTPNWWRKSLSVNPTTQFKEWMQEVGERQVHAWTIVSGSKEQMQEVGEGWVHPWTPTNIL